MGDISAQATIEIKERVPSSLTLDPVNTTVKKGVETCITGSVLDQFGDPLEEVDVFTEMDGNIVGSSFTDETGKVVYCLTPTEIGIITLIFYYEGGKQVSATINVIENDGEPVAFSLVVDPTNVKAQIGEKVCFKATVLDQFGNPFPGEKVFVEKNGEMVAEIDSDKNGMIEFCYLTSEMGTDELKFYYKDGKPVVAMVTVGEIEPVPFKIILTASDGAGNDYFGYSVDISGDWAIAGAFQDDDHGISSGSAYIYKFDGTTWVENAKLTASDGFTFDRFGIAVAIDGKWAVVGAHQDDDHGTSSGSAYVFEYAGGTWTEKAKLTASDAMTKDRFGRAVDISGNKIIVGAPDDDTRYTNSGSAYIFEYMGGTWTETSKLMLTDHRTGDHFGRSVAIDKDQVIVGAYKDNDKGVGHQAGSAYIFQYDGITWTQQIKLAASDAAAVDRFGVSVDIFDDRAIVGANLDDDDGESSGSAYIFHNTGGKWMEKAKLVASDGMEKDRFSVSVAIEGDKAVIGTPYDDMPGINSGAAYVYEYAGGSWSETMKLKPENSRTGDYFGWSASISGHNTMIGAYRSDPKGKESGSACIYDLSADMMARIVNKTDEKIASLEIEEESKAFEAQGPITISAYPNPVIQKLNIQFNKSVEKPVSFSLYDQLGRLIYSENEVVIDNPQTIELNLSELKVTPGLLFLRVMGAGEKESIVRLLKQ